MTRITFVSIFTLMLSLMAAAQASNEKDVLIRVTDTAVDTYGYRNEAGKMIVPMGKYPICITDTFRYFAIVIDTAGRLIAIDRQFHVIYNVFIFDNGPDEPVDGLFRIKIAGKIGYADAANGKIAIKPKFACAWPFENGVAKVALSCKTHSDGEHSSWTSNEWFYINKAGSRVKAPKSGR